MKTGKDNIVFNNLFMQLMPRYWFFRPRVAVIAHLFHEDLFDEFIGYFKNLPEGVDLFITTNIASVAVLHQKILFELREKIKKYELIVVPNKGRDMAPLLIELLPRVQKYDYVCMVHTKKSVHLEALSLWRKYLLDNLLGSSEIIMTILDLFKKQPNLGILFPQTFPGVDVPDCTGWNHNLFYGQWLANELELCIDFNAGAHIFPSGSMFWFRPQALQKLLCLNVSYDSFSSGIGNTDGDLPHALERIFVSVARSAAYEYKRINLYPIVSVATPSTSNL